MTDKGISIVYFELEKGKYFGAEQTSTHQLLIFVEGSCIVNYKNFTNRNFGMGQMVFIHRLSGYSAEVREKLHLLVISFEAPIGKYDKQLLNSQIQYSGAKYDFEPTHVYYPLTEYFHLLIYCLQKGIDSPLFCEQKYQELFLYLTVFYTKEEMSHLFYETIGKSFKFREFVYTHYANVSTLNELIDLSSMSRAVFFRKFKEEFGETAYQWMLKQKCCKILNYLEQPEMTIKEIIDKFRFSSFSNFNRFCKNNYGCSPTQLLERMQQKRLY